MRGKRYDAGPLLDLSAFKNLIKLTWRGILLPKEFEILKKFFEERYDKLEDLTLEVFCWKSADFQWEFDQGYSVLEIPFEQYILPHFQDGAPKRFSSLKSLTLIDFGWRTTNIHNWINAFNFAQLESLTLHFCHETKDLLRDLSLLGTPLRLKKLELVDERTEFFKQHFTNQLIQACEGLESLYIMHCGSDLLPSLWLSIDAQSATLRRLVVHTRVRRRNPRPFWWIEASYDDPSLSLQASSKSWIFSENAECVGLMRFHTQLVTFHVIFIIADKR